MLNKDQSEKLRRGYTDPDSIVYDDGREWLRGKDWKRRVAELEKRSLGQCERYSILGRPHDAFCYGRAEEPHHIIRRSKQRDDRLSNLAGLSHACHAAEDDRVPRWTQKA